MEVLLVRPFLPVTPETEVSLDREETFATKKNPSIGHNFFKVRLLDYTIVAWLISGGNKTTHRDEVEAKSVVQNQLSFEHG